METDIEKRMLAIETSFIELFDTVKFVLGKSEQLIDQAGEERKKTARQLGEISNIVKDEINTQSRALAAERSGYLGDLATTRKLLSDLLKSKEEFEQLIETNKELTGG